MPTAIRGYIARDRLLHIVLWFAQGLLGAIFAAMALLKLLSQPERLVEIMTWTHSTPLWFVYVLGALELLGAFLVTVPAVTSTPQRVVGWTAAIFAALMATATLAHAVRGELRIIPVTLAVGALSVFVAWGRLTHKPIEAV